MHDQVQRVQPVADQVLNILRGRIRGHVYDPEGRLPSESDLAFELHVSRSTIRAAMAALTAEKIIVRRQGDGTYINRRFVETRTHFGAISEFSSMIRASGHEASIKTLELFSRTAASKEVEALEILASSHVVVMVRLFYSDDQPAIYSIDAIPEAYLCQPLSPKDIEAPLPDFFQRFCHQEFTYGISTLSAQKAQAEVAEAFGLESNAPVLTMKEVFYNDRDQPLVFATNFFNETVFQLRVARSFN